MWLVSAMISRRQVATARPNSLNGSAGRLERQGSAALLVDFALLFNVKSFLSSEPSRAACAAAAFAARSAAATAVRAQFSDSRRSTD